MLLSTTNAPSRRPLALTLCAALVCGCAGPVAQRPADPEVLKISELLPPAKTASEKDKHIRQGVLELQGGRYARASKEFNAALRYDPQNAYYQFFNGLAYHLMAEQGDTAQYDQAQIGYELALKFDPSLWIAAQQLGRLYLSRNQYAKSQNYFAQALLQRPNEPELLHGLAQASYHAGDLPTALGAVRKARELDPKSAPILATETLVLAAAGRAEEAKKDLSAYGLADKGSVKVALLKEQVESLGQLRDAPNDQSAEGESEAAAAQAPAEAAKAAPPAAQPPPPAFVAPTGSDMVVIDVVMIRTENQETTNKGVNLLQGLQLQFGGSASFDEQRTQTAVAGAAPAPGATVKQEILGTFTVPAVTYNMNIFNSADSHNEIIARPSLIATNGRKSEFFSGDSLDVALQGTQTATSHTIDAGVSMGVTPTMLPDGRIAIDLQASRSFFETTPAGTFAQAVSTSKNTVSVNVVMNFDQTLLLNGLREKQTTQTKTGVPLLRDIPLIQYLFSNATTLDFHKSILILLTPRHVETGVDASDAAIPHDQRVGDQLNAFRKTYPDLFKYDLNSSHSLGHLVRHNLWQGLNKSHTFDSKWYGQPDSLKTIIQRNLSFLYY